MDHKPFCYILLLYGLMCSGHAQASLSISPNKRYFHEYESVSVSCSIGGTAKRTTTKGETSDCKSWGILTGSTCTIHSAFPDDSGAYWCESEERSNAINIVVHDGHVILESPILPVNQGDAVTLRCRYRKTPSNRTAVFYKDGSLVRTGAAGEMTIPAVALSDGGKYRCSNAERGDSPESLLTVTAAAPTALPSPTPPPPPSPTPFSNSTSPPEPGFQISTYRIVFTSVVAFLELIATICLVDLHRIQRRRLRAIAAATDEENRLIAVV